MIDFLLLCDSGLGEPRQPKIAEVRNYMLKRSSSALKTWVVMGVGAFVLALSAFFILSNISPDSTFAQTPEVIMYAENGDGPVRIFISEDPEGAGINWDVTGIDADDFTISGGVLSFKEPPNYESPTDRMWDADGNETIDPADDTTDPPTPAEGARDRMYQVTVRASEMRASGYTGLALSTETDITVQVTNENEDGMVSIDLRQPEVGTAITASVNDPDGTGTVTWQWSVSTVTNPVATADNHWSNATGTNPATATYTPAGPRPAATPALPVIGTSNDAGSYLRAVATYTDSLGVQRIARGVSEFPVRAEVSSGSDAGVSNPANGSPGFQQGADYTRSVFESLAMGMNVGLPVVATDPNTDTLTYELDDDVPTDRFATDGSGTAIASGDDAEYFSIDKATGQIKVKKPLDWDMKGTGADQGKYMFHVRAIDPSGEVAHVEVTVTAMDANDAPKVMGSRTTAQQTADAAIPAAASEIRVLEQDSDDRYDDVVLDTTTGLITSGTGMPDGDADATYYGTPNGQLGAAGSAMGLPVALALGNQNVFTAPDADERGQIFWDLRGDDADDFVLTQGGQAGTQGTLTGPDEPIALVFVNPPDYENPTDADGDSVYKVVLEARDSGGLMDPRPITIFVDNVAEQGKATLAATGNGIDQPTIGSTIVADVVDPDGGEAVVTWQWGRRCVNETEFSVIHGATSSSYTPVAGDNGCFLQATATYIDMTSDTDDPDTAFDERVQESAVLAHTATRGDGVFVPTGETDPDKVFRVSVTSKFAVRVAPGAPPTVTDLTFETDAYERSLVENAEVGSIVGAPVVATAEEGTTFGYDLDATTTNDDNFFTIDEHGQIKVGEISFRTGRAGIIYPADATAVPTMEDPVLDYEGSSVFRLVVTATDSEDSKRKATADVTIRLTDLNETPYFDKESRDAVAATIEYAESRVNRVVPLAVTEPDGDSLRWEVAGADAADFEIRDVPDIGDGKDRRELHFKSQPDYENPKDAAGDTDGDGAISGANEAAGDNYYHVIVRAIETTAVGGGPNQAAELPVTVQVLNSNEPGKVEIKWLQPEVNTPLPATLIDPDGNPTPTLPIVMADGDTEILAANITGWQWYRAKNSNPDLDPDMDTLGDATSDWETITGSGSPTTATYTPQGKTAAAGGAPSTGDAMDEGWKLLAKADYTDGEGVTKSAIGITYMAVRADVHDDRNNSPDFTNDTIALSAPESIAENAIVPGGPVDVDTNEDSDTLTYTLDNDKDPATSLDAPTGTDIVGNAADDERGDVSFFTIDKKTGQIKVAKRLDWDNNPVHPTDADGQYVFWVRATDPSGETDEDNDYIKVTVTATDVNDAPKVTDGLAEISINEVDSGKMDSDVTKFVALGKMIDPSDANAVIDDTTNPNLYHRDDEDRVDRGIWPEPIAGADGALFEYSTPTDGIGRRLHFKKANLPDYENPQDANRDNVYEVTVTVRDNGGAMGTKKVRITVMNVDEAGEVVLAPEQPHDGMAVTATLSDPDGVEIITDWTWYTAATRLTKAETDVSAIRGTDGTLKANVTEIMGATMNQHTGMVGQFLWAEADYRDGKSVEEDPVTALDERNDNPGTETATEHHKFQNTLSDGTPDTGDSLFHNSDLRLPGGAANAVRRDPAGGTGPDTPSTDPVLKERMVYENVPSTGYVGMPLDGLGYPDGEGGTGTRDIIGGPDGASFVFAEGPPLVTTTGATNYDGATDAGFYDSEMVGSDDIDADTNVDPPIVENLDPNDKMGQLAANVVTHFDYEGSKNEYIIEVTDPDAEVAVGPMRVTIKVMNVNEAPSAPEELKSGIAITGNSSPDYNEITDTMAIASWDPSETPVTTYRAQGPDAAMAVWTLNSTDRGDFTITAKDANGMDAATGATAELTFNAAPDYEMPADADMNNVYEITVTASDGTNMESRNVTVTVMNMDDMGRVTFSKDGADVTDAAVTVGDMLTGAVEDPDGNPGDSLPIAMDTMIDAANVTSWQWARHDAPADDSVPAEDSSGWADISGATSADYTVDMADDGKFLRATAMYTDNNGADTAMGITAAEVGSTPTGDVVAMYNTDGVAGIQKAEFETALRDYIFNRTLDKAGFEQVLRSYLGL